MQLSRTLKWSEIKKFHLYIATLIFKHFQLTDYILKKGSTTFAKGSNKACITWRENAVLEGACTYCFEQAKRQVSWVTLTVQVSLILKRQNLYAGSSILFANAEMPHLLTAGYGLLYTFNILNTIYLCKLLNNHCHNW